MDEEETGSYFALPPFIASKFLYNTIIETMKYRL